MKGSGVGGWHRNHRGIVRGNCPLGFTPYLELRISYTLPTCFIYVHAIHLFYILPIRVIGRAGRLALGTYSLS